MYASNKFRGWIVDRGPQRRLLLFRPVAALSGRNSRSDLPLPGDQRRGATAFEDLAPGMAAAPDRRAQEACGLRPRIVAFRHLRKPPRGGLYPRISGSGGSGRQQFVGPRPAGGTRFARLPRHVAH